MVLFRGVFIFMFWVIVNWRVDGILLFVIVLFMGVFKCKVILIMLRLLLVIVDLIVSLSIVVDLCVEV